MSLTTDPTAIALAALRNTKPEQYRVVAWMLPYPVATHVEATRIPATSEDQTLDSCLQPVRGPVVPLNRAQRRKPLG